MSASDAPPPFLGLTGRARNDELFSKLLDAAPDAVVITDQSGRIVLVNVQTERLFGHPRDALIGKAVEVLLPERFRRGHAGHRERFSANAKVRPMGSGLELFGCRRDGSEFPLEISLSPLPTDDGVLILASIRDITDRKQSERQMRRIQGHLLSAVESIQGAFAIFDANDALVLCNSSYRQLFGVDLSGRVVERSFTELLESTLKAGVFDLDGASEAELHQRCLSYHRDPYGGIDLRTQDGRSLRLVERRTAEGGTVTTIWDVSEDVERERELRAARALAEAASSAKSEFLSSMSHELRTPLNAILGFAQLLERDKKTPLSDKHRERIGYVLKGGEHLLRLIDDVLDLSRIEAGQVLVSPEPVSVAEVLSEVKTTLDSIAARAEIALRAAELPQDLPDVVVDRTRFKQALMNFGSNAIKYGKKGGTVELITSVEGEHVRVTVKDDGIGIPKDKHSKVFQPFQRAGQETGPIEGTGIGLAITKRLAELMHGAVGFSSTEGEGSEFWIEIPSYRPEPGVEVRNVVLDRAASSALAASDGKRYLVVYVEDNPSNIAFMEDLIADYDRVELMVAPTAEIGVELVRARQPHLVIMDINLPGMSGFEAAKLLRVWPETQNIPIVALSAAAMIRDKARVSEAGFYRYLTKPLKVEELVAVLEEILLPS